ncbi:MAG: hypothetical protein IPM95_06335 [Sphingobacteriales bacterium]|jgi:hypothetical protein|nr:hypothetical protein [Sphingobacteriales bacterium]
MRALIIDNELPIRRVSRFYKTDDCSLIMTNSDEVPVSQRKKQQLLAVTAKF